MRRCNMPILLRGGGVVGVGNGRGQSEEGTRFWVVSLKGCCLGCVRRRTMAVSRWGMLPFVVISSALLHRKRAFVSQRALLR
jgi:hypothetical protein